MGAVRGCGGPGSPAGCSSMAKAAMSARMAGKGRRRRLRRARSNGTELPAAVTSDPAPDMVSGIGVGRALPGRDGAGERHVAGCPFSAPWQPVPPSRAWCEQGWGSRGYLTRAENPERPPQGKSRRFWAGTAASRPSGQRRELCPMDTADQMHWGCLIPALMFSIESRDGLAWKGS